MYKFRSESIGHTTSRGAISFQPDIHDLRVEILEYLQGNLEQMRLLDVDFLDGDLFPQMKFDTFMDYMILSSGEL
jgi:hypothetical protein